MKECRVVLARISINTYDIGNVKNKRSSFDKKPIYKEIDEDEEIEYSKKSIKRNRSSTKKPAKKTEDEDDEDFVVDEREQREAEKPVVKKPSNPFRKKKKGIADNYECGKCGKTFRIYDSLEIHEEMNCEI